MKHLKKLITVLVVVALVVSLGSSAYACTVVAVGKDASVDGSTMVTHTCDGRYDNRIQIVEGGTHEAGEMVEIWGDLCQDTIYSVEKKGEIPQVEETYTYFRIGYPFMNEKGLAIGEHTWVGKYDLYNNQGMMYIHNLGALGLQRAATAKECVQIMGELAETYGYCDFGEELAVADPNEVWIFEVIGPGPLWTPDSGAPGAIWAARRLADDEVFAAANRSRLNVIDFDDPDNFMWSTDIVKIATDFGYYTEGEPFDFSKIFDTQVGDTSYTCSARVWRVFDLLAPSLELPIQNGSEPYAFSVKPDEKVSIQDLMAINRDHYEGTPYDGTVGLAAGPFGCPVRYNLARGDSPEDVARFSWPRFIAVKQCSYNFVAQCRPDLPAEIGTILWFGEDAPDPTVHVPLYAGTTEVPEEWYTSDRFSFDLNSAWWAFNLVNNWATLRWNAMYADIDAKRESLENRFFEEIPEIDAQALELYNAGDVDGAKAVLTDYVCKTMDETLDTWWDFAWELIARYHDGNCFDSTEFGANNLNPGYPTEWLEAVGYGQDQLADHNAWLETEAGQAWLATQE